MKLDILQHPDPRLREVCLLAKNVDPQLIENMFETMYAAPGRGLAAPQVGVMQRVFVMDTTWKEGDMSPMTFVNPKINNFDGEQVNEEACLSIQNHSQEVSRPDWIEVEWTDLEGASCSGRFEGFAAACVCHELDHLNGKLILDYRVIS